MKLLKSHVTTSVAVYGGAVILLLAAIWTAYQYVDPAPPKKVTIAAGSRSGAYYQNALKYAKIFAEQGVELEILETKGSMDNLARMSAPDSTVGAAFMQGGIAEHDEHPDLRSLGSLYYEPLWVFHRKGLKIKALPELKGLKVAIGPKGSGTNDLITNILDENGVEEDNADLIETPTSDTVRHLLDGTIDVMFLISGIHSDTIHALSAPNSGVHLMSFARAEAYSRSHRYLTQLTLPRGAINLADDIPSTNVNMLAPTANLVVQEDLHPALKFLFLLAARKVHSKGDIFAQPGTFPNQDALLFPLAEEAESFYKTARRCSCATCLQPRHHCRAAQDPAHPAADAALSAVQVHAPGLPLADQTAHLQVVQAPQADRYRAYDITTHAAAQGNYSPSGNHGPRGTQHLGPALLHGLHLLPANPHQPDTGPVGKAG